MKIKDLTKEELEALSYTDLAEMIIKENKKLLSTADIFKKICKLLGLSDEEYADKIGDLYISLTTDKRFILLDKGLWDLKNKHKVEINLEDEEDDDEELESEDMEEELENEEESEEEEYESIDITDDEVDLDDEDDDMEDLTIVDDEDLDSLGE